MREYTPNHIPASKRGWHIALSLGLLAYGILGLVRHDLFMPSRHGRGLHLHGLSAWLMFAAFTCAAANLLSVVVDHYDRRNNETNYGLFARLTQVAGWSLFGAALLARIFLR